MSGYPEVGEHPMQVVRDTDPTTIGLAEANVARRARDGDWSRADLVDVLEHLGLRAPEKPAGGKTNPVGRNVPPAVQQRRREHKAAQRKATREQKKRDAS